MLSSLNAYGGLSAAEILTLFVANSSASSSSSSTTSTNTSQSASAGLDASGVNDPANAIKAILAQAQMTGSSGGWASIATAQTAYAAEMGNSASVISESVAIASPDAVQQIAEAVSLVNDTIVTQTDVDPSTHDGISSYGGPVTATAANAVNVTMSGGAISATAVQGADFPNGLPSLATIQQALNALKTEDEGTGWNGVEATPEPTAKDVADTWWDSVDGSFTLVALPSNANGSIGGNMITFSANGNKWALVLPQDTVSISISETQAES